LPAAADNLDFQVWVGAFQQGLALLGWNIGRNVRIDTRWTTTNAAEIRRHAAELAGLALRHSCGYKLANDGHDTRALQHYLGHKNIQHTVRYTELAAAGCRNDGVRGFLPEQPGRAAT
jgi:integrase